MLVAALIFVLVQQQQQQPGQCRPGAYYWRIVAAARRCTCPDPIANTATTVGGGDDGLGYFACLYSMLVCGDGGGGGHNLYACAKLSCARPLS